MTALIRVAEFRRVPVLVHWSVFALTALILISSGRKLPSAILAGCAYLAMLLIHEFGHHWVAVRRGYRVQAVELYPIHGVCRIEAPRSELDRSFIAWGGVVAQFLVAIPLAVLVVLFGYTRFEGLNAILAILGFMSPAIAVLNLIPAGRLDGRAAWRLLPLLLERHSRAQKRLSRRGGLRAVK